MATTTPNYGWPVPTSTDLVKDGATAIEALGDAIDATVFGLGDAGLEFIKSQVIGTAVSSVNVTSAFSATYDDYKILVTGGVASTADNMNLKLGATATGYYNAQAATTFGGAGAGAANSNGTTFTRISETSTGTLTANFELKNPFAAKVTILSYSFCNPNTTGAAGAGAGFLNNTTSYTDFTLIPATGNYTGGTIYVYGYAKA